MSHIFIFEGPDGSGKSTVINEVAQFLQEQPTQIPCITCREPGGTIIGEQMRELLRHPDGISSGTEFSLFWSGRFDLWERKVLPFSQENQNGVVLFDRSFPSTYAYQVGGREGDQFVEQSCGAMQNLLLDVIKRKSPESCIHYVYFKIDLDTVIQRRNSRVEADEITQFNADSFQARVIQAYEVFFKKLESDISAGTQIGPRQIVHYVDATVNKEEVVEQVKAIFAQVLG